MDPSSTNQFNYYNEIYPMENDDPDSDFWDYEQARYELMKKDILAVLAEVHKRVEEFGNVIRVGEKKLLEEVNHWTNEIVKTRIYCREFFERIRINTLQSINLSELQEDELTTSQIEPSTPLKSVKPSNSPTIDTTSWTIGHDKDKKENTQNKSSPQTVVEVSEGYILTKVKKGKQYDHTSETHLKKKEALGMQPTFHAQFKEKENNPMFEPLVDKDSILRMSIRKILDKNENPSKLLDFIKISYPQKLKREYLTALTRNCNAISQGQLPQKKKDPGSFNSIGKLSIKEAWCGSSESIPSSLLRKIDGIQVKPSNCTLTLEDRSISDH